MKIKVVYLASLREQLGKAGEDLEIPPATSTVAGLRALLMARGCVAAALRKGGRCASPSTRKWRSRHAGEAGRRNRFFPPVTGG